MKLKNTDVVALKSFLNTMAPTGSVHANENYWLLVGEKGVVLKTESESTLPRHGQGERVLVRFDTDIRAKGLECHNTVDNSLWIFVSDLEKV